MCVRMLAGCCSVSGLLPPAHPVVPDMDEEREGGGGRRGAGRKGGGKRREQEQDRRQSQENQNRRNYPSGRESSQRYHKLTSAQQLLFKLYVFGVLAAE